MSEQLRLDEWYVKGSTADINRDGPRLGAQMQRVWSFMRDNCWHSLAEISAATGDPQPSVSARLRSFRELGYKVERMYLKQGLHLYRVTKP